MNIPMSRYARNTKAGTLLQWHAVGKFNHQLERKHRVLGSGSEGAIALSAITPHATTDPFPCYALAHCINCARTIAVRNDTRVWHPDAKRIFTFLDVARIDAREGDSNANFACAGLGVFHVADDEYISRCALLFVPSGFHFLAEVWDSDSPSWTVGDSARQQTPYRRQIRNQGLWASLLSCCRFAAARSLALSGLVSGTAKTRSNHSISAIVCSASMRHNI